MNLKFDPKQWIIVQYRPATGGKFLCAALLTIDAFAHWDPLVETKKISWNQWVNQQWQHTNDGKWLAYEPLHQWKIRFFSRTFPRGNHLTLEESINCLNSSSQYFLDSWAQDRLILDFVNKTEIPVIWKDSRIIKLDAKKDCKLHREILLKKLYPWDPQTGMGLNMMDHPFSENPSINARIYKNQYEFGPFATVDEWYDYIWRNDFRLNFELPNPDIWLHDLLNFDKVENFVAKLSTELGSTFRRADLEYVWKYWIGKNKKFIDAVDFKI